MSARLWDAHEALCDVYGFAPAVEPWLDEIREAARKAAGPRAGAAAELDLDGATELALAAVSV